MNAEIPVLAAAADGAAALPVGGTACVDGGDEISLVRQRALIPDGGEQLIAWGPGPRASQSLMLAVRARALSMGRLAPLDSDVSISPNSSQAPHGAWTFSERAEGPHNYRR